MAQLDNDLIKKAHAKVRYTPEMADELKQCIDPISGPMYFMENFMFVQHPIKGKVKFTPYKYQRELCVVYNEHRYSIAMIGRQLGKCLSENTKIRIRNKKTGKIQEITMGQFHKLLPSNHNNDE